MVFFMYAYWHDARFKKSVGGPIKVYELATNLTRLGHDVHLFLPKIGYPERQTTANVIRIPFIDLPIIRFICYQVLSFLYSLMRIVKYGRPDIIHVRIMWSFIPMLLGKLFSIPIMLEDNSGPHRAYMGINSRLKRRLVHLIDKISYKLSDNVLPETQGIAEYIHNTEGVPRDKLTVLPSGTNTDLFRPLDKESCCKKLGLDMGAMYIGFIGTFFRHQGIDTLIHSAPLVLRAYPNTKFLLVGDGPLRTAWEQQVRENDLDNYFIFTGFVPYEEVPTYCGVMDVCVAPFLKEAKERSAVKVFDYLACGKPAVVSDIGETSDFFLDSGAIITIIPEDPVSLAQGIIHLLKNEALRDDMGRRGWEFVCSQFSRIKIAEIVEATAFRLQKKRF